MAAYDYIVVGAGSAGCVVAARLSEHSDVSVLLIEAGGPDTNPDIHAPLGAWALWGGADDWWFPTTKQKGASDRVWYLPRGKVLGGSSSLNGMIYIRGARADYDHWAYLGNPGWDYDSVLPYFKKSEDYYGGANAYHGAGGPLTVTRNTQPSPMTQAFIEAGVSLGIKRNDDFAGADPLGIGTADLTIRDGRRWSTASAFLRPAMNRPNLTVTPRAAARRLVIAGGRCTGIEYIADGAVETATATREVVLCAGAIGSPTLLMLSGVGRADDLKAVGVPVVHDLPGVGQNLQDHVVSFVIHEGKKPLPASRYQALEAHLFAKSDARLPAPDHQPLFMNMAPPLPYLDVPPNSYAVAPGIIRPASIGEMKLVSSDPDVPPSIDPAYLREQADRDRLLHSLELSLEIINAPAFNEWRKGQVYPKKTDKASLKQYIRDVSETYHHQTSTCKMGIDAMAVVDPELRVHGLAGLRVADASIMPAVVSGNTNAPTIMIGERCADLLLQG